MSHRPSLDLLSGTVPISAVGNPPFDSLLPELLNGALGAGIALIGVLVTQIVLCRMSINTFTRGRRTQIADEGRKQLIAGGDALEQFHWALQEALNYVTDMGPAAPDALDVAGWRRLANTVDRCRDAASKQGTRIAIDFGCVSSVRWEYDRHQQHYRGIADCLLAGRREHFHPPSRLVALGLQERLRTKEWATDYINAASAAARAREQGTKPAQRPAIRDESETHPPIVSPISPGSGAARTLPIH